MKNLLLVSLLVLAFSGLFSQGNSWGYPYDKDGQRKSRPLDGTVKSTAVHDFRICSDHECSSRWYSDDSDYQYSGIGLSANLDSLVKELPTGVYYLTFYTNREAMNTIQFLVEEGKKTETTITEIPEASMLRVGIVTSKIVGDTFHFICDTNGEVSIEIKDNEGRISVVEGNYVDTSKLQVGSYYFSFIVDNIARATQKVNIRN